MNKIYKSFAVAALAIIPLISIAITSDKTPEKEVRKSRLMNAEEKISDAVRDEIKKFHETKRTMHQEHKGKVEELKKSLSPEAKKVMDERKNNRKDKRSNADKK